MIWWSLRGLTILYSSTTSLETAKMNLKEFDVALLIERIDNAPTYHFILLFVSVKLKKTDAMWFKDASCTKRRINILYLPLNHWMETLRPSLVPAACCFCFALANYNGKASQAGAIHDATCRKSDHLETRKMLASLHWSVLTCLSWSLTFIKLRHF